MSRIIVTVMVRIKIFALMAHYGCNIMLLVTTCVVVLPITTYILNADYNDSSRTAWCDHVIAAEGKRLEIL